jgi:hypothetical protein
MVQCDSAGRRENQQEQTMITEWLKSYFTPHARSDSFDQFNSNRDCFMKTNWLIPGVLAGLLVFAAVGCKPKETTLSGQVFIVTKGAENFKLGDVGIFLIEKSQVTNYLQEKQPAIESEMASKRQAITNAEQEVAIAQTNANKAQVYFDWFTENKPYKTYADYFKVSSQWTNLFKQYVLQTNYVQRLYVYATNGLETATYLDQGRFDAATAALQAAVKKREEMVEQLNSLTDQKTAIKTAALDAERDKLEIAKSSLAKANSDADAARTILDNSPIVADYFEDFFPHDLNGVKKTISDSDGKFSFSYPIGKPFAIFVRAQRAVLDKTETYCWLVDAPAGVKAAQILLSNNNLAFVDPDGYFKLKPKEVQQVLAK